VGLEKILDPRHLDLAVSQVQCNVDLIKIPNLKHLDLVVCQVQGNVSLIIMLDLRHLDLIVNQVQGNVCLTNMPDPRHLNLHYQKFAKYQRLYRRHISVGNLRSELPTDTFSSVIQSVTTDGKVFELKKRRVADVEVLAGHFFRRHHRRIQKWQPVQWRDRCTVYITDGLTEGFEMADPYGDVSMFPSESQTWSPTEYPSVNPSRKVNICQLCRPSPPLFLLLLS